jgi:coenzyme F420-0:L-glutamate ligase/coenzyme F420-1:gamma-L-glutamate ligase
MPDGPLTLRALQGIPEVHEGADLAQLISEAATRGKSVIGNESVLVISHKVVSKAEGAVCDLRTVEPSERALEIAEKQGRDPRHVQVILDESSEVLREVGSVLVCVTAHGLVCANAGTDRSNVPDPESVVVLPKDPDRSAREIRSRIFELTGAKPAVVIADSFGRAWRVGQVDIAVGCAGLVEVDEWEGRSDRDDRPLSATAIAVADAATAAADLARAKDSGEPVVLIDGLGRFVTSEDGFGAVALRRPPEQDLFRG